MYYDNINLDDLIIKSSEKNVNQLQKYLIETVNMSEKRVNNTLKKFNNILKQA